MQHHWALDTFLPYLGLWALIFRHQGESLSLGGQSCLVGRLSPGLPGSWLFPGFLPGRLQNMGLEESSGTMRGPGSAFWCYKRAHNLDSEPFLLPCGPEGKSCCCGCVELACRGFWLGCLRPKPSFETPQTAHGFWPQLTPEATTSSNCSHPPASFEGLPLSQLPLQEYA